MSYQELFHVPIILIRLHCIYAIARLLSRTQSMNYFCVGNKMFCGDVAMNGMPSLKRITIRIENKKALQNS